MRNLKQICTLSVAGLLLALGAISVEASKAQKMVSVAFNRVAQENNLDVDLPWMRDKADFYAEVWIDGAYHKTRNFSEDDGQPGWVISAPATGRYATIRIRLMDDDGGLEKKDDHVDINPRDDTKDLVLTYDTETGVIAGDVSGRAGQMLFSQGARDSGKGKVWFTIS